LPDNADTVVGAGDPVTSPPAPLLAPVDPTV